MARRIERSEGENRRVGIPTNATRLDILERVVEKLIAISVTAGDLSGTDRTVLDSTDMKALLDQKDTDFPE